MSAANTAATIAILAAAQHQRAVNQLNETEEDYDMNYDSEIEDTMEEKHSVIPYLIGLALVVGVVGAVIYFS